MRQDHDDQPTRRSFLDGIIAFCALIGGLAMAVPSVMYLWPAARGGAAQAEEVPGADQMARGQSRMIQVGGKAVIVVRHRTEFKALSAVCTHLGCLVKWDSEKSEFLCPCHAAVFDADGGVVSGPPPGPLPAYRVKEVGGKVFVSGA